MLWPPKPKRRNSRRRFCKAFSRLFPVRQQKHTQKTLEKNKLWCFFTLSQLVFSLNNKWVVMNACVFVASDREANGSIWKWRFWWIKFSSFISQQTFLRAQISQLNRVEKLKFKYLISTNVVWLERISNFAHHFDPKCNFNSIWDRSDVDWIQSIVQRLVVN